MTGRLAKMLGMLRGDIFALAACIFLIILLFGASFGPSLIENSDVSMNLRMRNAPPFQLENGFGYILGADSLGRPILPRILYGARTTLGDFAQCCHSVDARRFDTRHHCRFLWQPVGQHHYAGRRPYNEFSVPAPGRNRSLRPQTIRLQRCHRADDHPHSRLCQGCTGRSAGSQAAAVCGIGIFHGCHRSSNPAASHNTDHPADAAHRCLA